MTLRRRDLLGTALGSAAASVLGCRSGPETVVMPEPQYARFRIGGCDWSLRQEGRLEAFAAAKEAGLDGVEVSLGKGKDHLPMSDPEKQQRFAAEARKSGLAIPSTCLEILHRDGLKGHPDAPKWLAEAIGITAALGAKAILLPSFGGQALEKREEQKAVAERLKPLAPVAEKAGVVLGLENTLSAEDNAWIIDQVGSPAVQVYYDVGNSFPKFDVYREIVWLGGKRVCSIHLKDRTPILGQGKIDFPRFVESVLKSGYTGWLMLETGVATTVKDDFAANANYIRGLLKQKGAS
jgi:sugar phosphate isomerase/epimerase